MAKKVEFVELFAGMAAVTQYIAGRKPPVAYMGGKRGYAAKILDAMALAPSDVASVTLVEADPVVANALRYVFDVSTHDELCTTWESWADDEPAQRKRFKTYCEEGRAGWWASADPFESATRWLWMRPRTFPTTLPQDASPGDCVAKIIPTTGSSRWALHAPSHLLRGTGPFPVPIVVVNTKASEYRPHSGAVVYLDPPYRGTKSYAFEGSDVPEDIAQRWADVGSPAYVSEGLPLGPNAVELSKGGRRYGKRGYKGEWLTVFTP